MAGRSDYTKEAVEAARSVLLELHRILGEYRQNIVVIGGWVPELLLPGPHVGTMDVDLALDHAALSNVGYATIQKHLRNADYEEDERQPFIFWRKVPVGGKAIDVEVDLLAGEYEGTGKGHRTQKVQDVRPRKARGCDLAFRMYSTVEIRGVLPGGGEDSASVKVADIVPFLVMKGMALHDRIKAKEAWDVCFCLRNFPGAPEALVREFSPHVTHGLVREGLQKIADKCSSPDHVGPRLVADFAEATDPEERDRLQRDAYERVNYLIEKLRIE